LASVPAPNTKFGRFFRGLYASQCKVIETQSWETSCSELLPMPLPFPEAESHSGSYTGHRRLRHNVLVVAQKWVNRQIALFSYYELGANAFASIESLAKQRPSAPQMARANQLVQDVLPWIRARPIDPSATGGSRGYQKLEALLNSLGAAGYGSSNLSSMPLSHMLSCALDVKPDRVAIPAKAGGLRTETVLEEPFRTEFLDVKGRWEPVHSRGDNVKACHKLSAADEVILLQKLWEADMIEFRPEAELLVSGASGKREIRSGGFFCVPHKLLKDRLIYDRRPRNALEKRYKWCCLPNGTQLVQLVIEEGETVRGSLDDLSNFFHCLSQAPGATPLNPVGRRWVGAQLNSWGFGLHLPRSKAFRACLKVQGMGDHNGPDIAQMTHEAILRRHGCLDVHEQLRFDTSVPIGRTWTGVYIDDKLIVSRLPISQVRQRKATMRDVQLVKAGEAAYECTEGLSRAVEKEVRFKETFTGWGTEVRGRKGSAGAPRAKRSAICFVLAQLLRYGSADRKMLEKAITQAVHPIMHRREFFCILERTHTFISSLPYGVIVSLPGYVRDEIAGLILALPFCEAQLRWGLGTCVSAVDATPTREGACESKCPKALLQGFYRMAEHKGAYTRIDWNPEHLDSMPPVIPKPCKEVEELVSCLPWHVTVNRDFKQQHHINVQEMRCLGNEVRRLASSSNGSGIRRVCFSDSMVASGAWAKGRSSSRALNFQLRQSLGWAVLGRVKLVPSWIGTKVNPADDPSRDAPLRTPDPVPAWATQHFVNSAPWLVNSDVLFCSKPPLPQEEDDPSPSSTRQDSAEPDGNNVSKLQAPAHVNINQCALKDWFCCQESQGNTLHSTCIPHAPMYIPPLSSSRAHGACSGSTGVQSQRAACALEQEPPAGHPSKSNGEAAPTGVDMHRNSVCCDNHSIATHKRLQDISSSPSTSTSSTSIQSKLHRKKFLELWAGAGGLTFQVNKYSSQVCEPIEAFPRTGYRPEHDLRSPLVRKGLLARASAGEFGWMHLGIVCTTWSVLRQLSIGTRSRGQAQGDGSRDDENIANGELLFAIQLMTRVLKSGGFVSLENPKGSLIWWHPAMQRFVQRFSKPCMQFPLFKVEFDQCMYGLRSPPGAEALEIWKKPTCILSNIPDFRELELHCDHSHEHTTVVGALRVGGHSCRRSTLAGKYPLRLCRRMAQLGARVLDEPVTL